MSISIKLYSFSKYENSTKVPSGSAGTTYNGVLIEPCSVLNPVIKVNGINGYSYNYAYISTFSRYYFITDWETQDGFWYLTLRVDPMGSFKTTIGSSTQFVERAAGAQDTYLVDTLYPTTGKYSAQVVELEQGLQDFIQTGWFVLNITGSSQSTIGPYVCDWHTFKNVVKEMVLKYDNNSWWTNIGQGIRNSVYQPFKHLGNVIWFPYNYIDVDGYTGIHGIVLGPVILDGSTVHDGVYDMTFYHLTAPSMYTSTSETLPKHPEAATHGKYMNLKPFTQYIYHDDVFGSIELDPAKLIDATTVSIGKMTDPTTGVQVLHLPDGQSRVGQVGVMIPMENNSLNIGGFLTSVISTVASAYAGDYVGAAVGAVSATDSLIPTTTTTCQMGSMVLTWNYTTINCYFWETTGHDPTNKGKLYCKTKQINTLSGYIQTSDAHISSTSMSSAEQDMITSIMDSGFYYE